MGLTKKKGEICFKGLPGLEKVFGEVCKEKDVKAKLLKVLIKVNK